MNEGWIMRMIMIDKGMNNSVNVLAATEWVKGKQVNGKCTG